MRRRFAAFCRAILAVAVVGAIAAAARGESDPRPASPTEAPSAAIETQPLMHGVIPEEIVAYGSVTADGPAAVTLSFAHAGQISRIFVRAGQTVHAGDPLATLTTDADVSQGFAKATSDVRFARVDLERTRRLLAQRLATNAQIDQAQKAVADAESALAAQRRQGAGAAEETLSAPADGAIVGPAASLGDRLPPGAPVVRLARRSGLRVMVGIEADDLARVKPGLTALVTSVFAPGPAAGGVIASVGGAVEPTTGLVDAALEVGAPPPGLLIAGTAVAATITVSEQSGWIAPRLAVLRDGVGPGAHVFQVANGVARKVAVTIRLENDQVAVIDGPLDAALALATVGADVLSDGMAVRVTPTVAAAK